MENPHNFKVGDLVMGTNVSSVVHGKICRIDSIGNWIGFSILLHDSKTWSDGYSVGALSLFRPLTKLDKALK